MKSHPEQTPNRTSIHIYLHQETNHITQAREKSRTERSMNDAHNCPNVVCRM